MTTKFLIVYAVVMIFIGVASIVSCNDAVSMITEKKENYVRIESRPEIHMYWDSGEIWYSVELNAIVFLEDYSYNAYFNRKHTNDFEKVDSLRTLLHAEADSVASKIIWFYTKFPQEIIENDIPIFDEHEKLPKVD